MNLEKILKDLEVFKAKAPQKYYDIVQITGPLFLFNQKLSTFTGKKIEDKYRVSHTELDVIWTLYTSQTNDYMLTPSKIKENLIFTQGAITNILKKLEIREYITRVDDEYDKRIKHVKLTQLGKELCENAMEEIFIHEKKIFSCLEKDEVEVFIKILHKLLNQGL